MTQEGRIERPHPSSGAAGGLRAPTTLNCGEASAGPVHHRGVRKSRRAVTATGSGVIRSRPLTRFGMGFGSTTKSRWPGAARLRYSLCARAPRAPRSS